MSRPGRTPVVLAGPALLAVVLAGCDLGLPTEEAAASSALATIWPAGRTGSMDVVAEVDGREIAGRCTGLNSGEPTVLLEVGMGAPRDELQVVEDHLAPRTVVCTYDRAGTGNSDPPESSPRPVAEVVSDALALLDQVAEQGAAAPFFLVGQSFGGELVMRESQTRPDLLAGFVAMNPSPPFQTWLARARTVETEEEVAAYELPSFTGGNAEGVDTTADESLLTDPLPAELPYAVVFDEACGELPPSLQAEPRCGQLIAQLELTMVDLAHVGAGGSFARVPGAGHAIYASRPESALAMIDHVWARATAG
ncbi:alpha/beta fold hydrolase [Petropleomorpha daqingensis]|uniref:Pimeloyl-ACP methyl ester carboxylesterase n=1 Tax=Petropleomorpha daqingensis TaxID=2026353 RepID=A0A853CGG8_9ACTN|nr:alpha/beta hydrolase [Petropleomorpha daqingensis]NYJ05652.1 pimeloyl-ACP methyl ester carboxylesterase [Petropleomorpha daqingensis]